MINKTKDFETTPVPTETAKEKFKAPNPKRPGGNQKYPKLLEEKEQMVQMVPIAWVAKCGMELAHRTLTFEFSATAPSPLTPSMQSKTGEPGLLVVQWSRLTLPPQESLFLLGS